jgi:hypothetical protein
VRVNDVLKYEIARGSFGGDYWVSHVYALNNPDLSAITKSTPQGGGPLITEYDNRSLHIDPNTGIIEGVDPNMKPMSHNNFDVTTEYLLAPQATLTVRYTHKALRYGIEDIGVLDENESEVYTTGNPGFGLTSDSVRTATGASLTPKAQRDYDGLEFRVTGRAQRLFYNASYTYSKLFGNWAGLANSDEAGRSDPNVSRAFDLSPSNFDQNGQNVYGRLATDRPHSLKLFGNYALESRLGTTMLGLSQAAYSGTPLSSEITFIVPVFYNGRGDMGRTDTFTQTDLLASHAIRFGGNKRAVFEFYVFNLFNQSSVTNRTQRYNRNGNLFLFEELYNGTIGDPTRLINGLTGASPALNPIYNQPLTYQDARRINIGLRLQF